MTRNLRTIVLVAAGLVLSALALVLVAGSIDLGATGRLLGTLDPLPVGAALVVLAGGVLLRSLRWRLLLTARPDGSRVPLWHVVASLLVGYLGNTIMPARLGEAARTYAISQRWRIPFSTVLGSVALERVLDTAVVALLGFLAAVGLRAPAWLVGGSAAVAVVATVILAVLLIGSDRGERLIAGTTPEHQGAVGHLRRAGGRFIGAMAANRNRSTMLAAAGLSVAAWLLDGLIVLLAARSLGISLAPAAALLIAAFAVLGTIVPSAPGYVGTYELAASSAATALGVAAPAALALAILVHVVTLLPIALGGALSLPLLGIDVRHAAEPQMSEQPSGARAAQR